MAVSASLLTASGSTTAGSSVATASVTPTANRLVLAFIHSSDGAATSVTGNGLTWVQIVTAGGTNTEPTTVYRAMGASPSAGAITFNFGGTQSEFDWVVVEYDGVDTSGTNGSGAIVQSNQSEDAGTPTSETVTLSSAITAGNAVAAAFYHHALEAQTAGGGYTKLGENAAGGADTLAHEWREDGTTTPSMSWTTGARCNGVAVEIAVAGGGGGGPVAPTIPTVGAGRVLSTNQLNTTATRTFPAMSGLTKNAGDLLIAIIVAYQSSTTNAQFSGWSDSFTEFHDSGTSTTLAIGAAYKWSDGTETAAPTVTQAATITGDASMFLLSIAGAHATTPPEAGSRADGTSAVADPASFNPGGWDSEPTLWISVVGSGMTSGTGSWTATGTTGPTNYTDRVDTNASDTSTTGDCEAAVAFRQLTAASEDIDNTAGVDTSNARNSALVIAVRPAEVPAGLPILVMAPPRSF